MSEMATPRIYPFTSEPGTPFRPSNGQEGRMFQNGFCNRCIRDHQAHIGYSEDGCRILLNAIMYGEDDPLYPREWVIADDGYPTCTDFTLEDECEGRR